MLKRLVFITLFISCSATSAFSQTPADNWYFGEYVGIRFENDTVIQLANSEALSDNCVVTMSEDSGELYFYSGTWTGGGGGELALWNKEHEVMPNGTNILAQSASTQGIGVCPNPANPIEHYIFTLHRPPTEYVVSLYYSVLDHDEDGGLGDIDPNQKNVFVIDSLAEKMAIVQKTSEDGYWIIVHQLPGNELYVYELDSNGLNPSPQVFYGALSESYQGRVGYMKASPDGQKLAICMRVDGGYVEIFDFDQSTGSISNPIAIRFNQMGGGGGGPYALEFSPNSQLLYACDASTFSHQSILYQWNVSVHDSASIANSIDTISDTSYLAGGMQIGPDSMLYLSNEFGLSRIENPNIDGIGCNLVNEFIDLNGRTGACLPYFPTYSLNRYVPDTTDTTTTDTTDSTISVQEIYNSQPYVPYLDVFPNPTGSISWINMKVEGQVRIDLMDLAGRRIRTVYEGLSSNSDVIESDLSDLAPGVYVYSLSTESGQYNHKVVKR